MSQFLEKLRNDISKLYENADDYNVLIEIGEGSEKKTFKAHSVILRSRCNFFHVALSNDWSRRDTENSEMMSFKKPNISPKVFEIILKYIYTGNLDLYNRETKDLLELLQALDELGLEELFEYIQDFFIVHESKWIKDYLYQVIEIAFQHEHYKKLQAFCVDIISDHPSNFFASNFFTSINESMLSAIISRDELKLQEIKIWNYLIKWGIVNSSIKNEDVSKWIDEDFSILQNKLVKLIPLIRFSDISISEFDEYVRPYDSILPEVLRSTPSLRYTFSKSQLDDVPLSLIPRKPPYYIDSLIIGPKESALIANWINPMEGKSVNGRIQFGNIKFHLLHRASLSSFSFECFHNHCDGKGPAIVLFKISSNSYMENNKEIIGAYNSVGWNSLDNYIETDHSFIFSFSFLFNKTMITRVSRIQQRCRKFAIYDGVRFGPCFGKGDLEFSSEENPNEGFCRQRCYDEPIRSTEEKFLIEEMEVFKVIKSRNLD